ncbi:MAG: RloB family protein [Bacteroidales bacterium]|nr:RloB family protein [Bacteroidales bacterium]
MTKNKRTYSKQSPDRELLPKRVEQNVQKDRPHTINEEGIASEYKKVSKSILPTAFFIIISGGEKKEKDYFKIISCSKKIKRIKIEYIADPAKLTPKGMLSTAQYLKGIYSTSQNHDSEPPDQYYIISDVDHFIDELKEIIQKCKKEKLNLIISNSCFEVWLYYAYKSEKPNFIVPSQSLKISSEFKRWLPESIEGGANPVKAIFNIRNNIINAKANYNEDAHGIPVLFSTNMFLLAEELLPLIEPELKELIECSDIRANRYRNTI